MNIYGRNFLLKRRVIRKHKDLADAPAKIHPPVTKRLAREIKRLFGDCEGFQDSTEHAKKNVQKFRRMVRMKRKKRRGWA